MSASVRTQRVKGSRLVAEEKAHLICDFICTGTFYYDMIVEGGRSKHYMASYNLNKQAMSVIGARTLALHRFEQNLHTPAAWTAEITNTHHMNIICAVLASTHSQSGDHVPEQVSYRFCCGKAFSGSPQLRLTCGQL